MSEDYTRELVEALVPAIFDRTTAWGMVDEHKPDPDMPKGTAQKNRGNTLWAHLADIRTAFARAELNADERSALFWCAGVGENYSEAGRRLSVDKATVMRRFERAVGKLTNYLNGDVEAP